MVYENRSPSRRGGEEWLKIIDKKDVVTDG